MPKTIDDLRALVKERIDDTSYKTEGVGVWALLLPAAGIILYMISCDRVVIFNSFDKIAVLSSIYLLLLAPLANVLYHIDTRELYRRDKATISTFFPKPFIGDNITKVILLLIIISVLNFVASKYLGQWKIGLCEFTAGGMMGYEWSAIEYKKKYKQELFPMYSFMLIFPIILAISAACLILPSFTYGLEPDVIGFSLSLAASVGLLYYGLYVFYLSPKTQLNNKLRACYNRLLSREHLNMEEEHKRFLQAINGLFIDELFEKDFTDLYNERKLVLEKCSKAYDLLDFKDDYSMVAFERVSDAHRLTIEAHQFYSKQVLDFKKLIAKIGDELKRHPDGAIEERVKNVVNSIQLYGNTVTEDSETFNILIDACNNKIREFRSYYKRHLDCTCKYAPYKRRYGHFIGCRIIPRIDRLFRKN